MTLDLRCICCASSSFSVVWVWCNDRLKKTGGAEESAVDWHGVNPRPGVPPHAPGYAKDVSLEDPTNLLHRLWQFMRTLSPVPPRSFASPSYLKKDLATCPHVYLRCDRVRWPLEPPYDGPFGVLPRGPKAFRIQRDNREEVDRLKAAVPDNPTHAKRAA
ncbi:hypothetical protein SprV_0100037400 [Sparganum proliferum]